MTDMQIKETKPTDRVKVYSNPMAHPGKCAICGNGADPERMWIDFGAQVPDYGALYICSVCIDEVCNALNYASPTQTSEMLGEIAELTGKLEAAQNERDSLRSAILNLSAGGIDVDVSSNDANAPAVAGKGQLSFEFPDDDDSGTELDLS